jgi:hypothetical protein
VFVALAGFTPIPVIGIFSTPSLLLSPSIFLSPPSPPTISPLLPSSYLSTLSSILL